jgi:hypothetical protein
MVTSHSSKPFGANDDGWGRNGLPLIQLKPEHNTKTTRIIHERLLADQPASSVTKN